MDVLDLTEVPRRRVVPLGRCPIACPRAYAASPSPSEHALMAFLVNERKKVAVDEMCVRGIAKISLFKKAGLFWMASISDSASTLGSA